MLIGLDQHDEWYRMHAVLSRWLSGQLRDTDPDRWREIQVAAAQWWSAEGDPDLAIEHAAAARDVDLLEALVLQHCAPYAARGMYRTLERWMEHFSEERVRNSMALKQVNAVLNVGFGNGERALSWTRLCRAEQIPVDDAPSSIDHVLALQADALFATLEYRPAGELVPIARNAYANLPPGEWRALACLALGANGYLCGHDDAIDVLREALFENEVAHATTLQATAAATLAIVVDLEGSADDAAELSRRANRLLSTPLGKDASATALSLAIASLVDARSGRHADATTRRDARATETVELRSLGSMVRHPRAHPADPDELAARRRSDSPRTRARTESKDRHPGSQHSPRPTRRAVASCGAGRERRVQRSVVGADPR